MNGFWAQYDQFFPLMSNYRFGDDFAANTARSSATISGNNLPDINQAIAMLGPEQFPLFQGIQGAAFVEDDPLPGASGIATGPDLALIEQRSQPTRFNNFLNRIGVGMLGLILIAAGILYLGLIGYEKATGESISDTVKGAA